MLHVASFYVIRTMHSLLFFTFHLFSHYCVGCVVAKEWPKIRQSMIKYTGSLLRWDKWIVDQASNVPSIILFIIFYRLRALKTCYFWFCKFIKKKKKNWNSFCKEFCKKLWKKPNDTWNMGPLVYESFVPANQRTSILYCRFANFKPYKMFFFVISNLLVTFNSMI